MSLGFRTKLLDLLCGRRALNSSIGPTLFVQLTLRRRHQNNCGLAAIKPFPLQYEKTETEKSDPVFKRDHKKLLKYYARLGFKKLPGADFQVFSLEHEQLPTDKQFSRAINERFQTGAPNAFRSPSGAAMDWVD
jgi:hypothetical protein